MSYCNYKPVHQVLDSTKEIRAALQRIKTPRAAPLSKEGKQRGMPSAEHSALPILLSIARHCNQRYECWLSYATIATESMWSRRSVVDSIPILVKAGLIQITGQHSSGANEYRLVVRALHQCEDCTSASLADGSASLAPEVIPELVPEVAQGSKSLTTTSPIRRGAVEVDFGGRGKGAGGKEREIQSSTSPVRQEGDKQEQQSDNHSCATKALQSTKTDTPRHAPAVAPVASGPATALAARYYEHLSHPVAHHAAKDEAWPQVFDNLLHKYTYDDLSAAIAWAFNIDTFWPQHLFRRSGNPVEYFQQKVDSIMSAWRGYARSQQNQSKPVASVPVPSSKLSSLWERNRI